MRIDFESDRRMAARIKTVFPPARRKPWIALLAAVVRLAGDRVELLSYGETPWVSVTFSGARHRVTLAFTGAEAVEDGDAFIAALPEHEFTIPHQLVASATIVSADHDLLPEPSLVVEAELLLLDQD